MPGYPAERFLAAVAELVSRNARLGFRPFYDDSWEKDSFLRATSIYLRPFSWSEGGIGLNLSSSPSVIMVATPVGSYFDPDADSTAVTTNMVRATDNGTGWIKCNANYVIPTLAKKQAISDGYMEAIFLDYRENKYIEEGSSCNIFFLLKNGSLVTPALEDRVLNGVNRRSVMQLATDEGVAVEERRISIDEVLDQTEECFVTGTAAGISYIESITHKSAQAGSDKSAQANNAHSSAHGSSDKSSHSSTHGSSDKSRTARFGNGKMGEFTRTMLNTLKGIQYGAVEDRHGWMHEVESS